MCVGNGTAGDPILNLPASMSPIQFTSSIAIDSQRQALYYTSLNFQLFKIMLNNGSQSSIFTTNTPYNSVEVEASGSILVATLIGGLTRISLTGVSTQIFSLSTPNSLDSGTTSTVYPGFPGSVSVEPSGSFLYVDITIPGKLRRVSGTTVTTLAGAANCNPNAVAETVSSNWCLGQNFTYYSGRYAAVSDLQGGYFWLDGLRNLVFRVYSSGRLERLSMESKTNVSSSVDALTARLWSPGVVSVNPQGGYLVTDAYRISKVDTAGTMTTVVGEGYFGYTSDGG
jgi:hypothetical protein